MDHTSPYFLGPQDRPGDLITPSRLRGDNYEEWATSIRLALRARRKFGFVDGSIVVPVSPCTEDDWLTIHSMIVSWLMNTIDPEIKSTLSIYEDAKLLWNDLKERFSIANNLRIHQLKAGIAKWDQTPNMTVATYYGKLKALWDELNNHEPLLNCVCGNIGSLLKKRREEERLHQFLMGLDSGRYGQLRTTILSQDPLPSLNKAYQLVTQEEQVRGKGAINEVPLEMSKHNSKETGLLTPNKSSNMNINNNSSNDNSINDINDTKANSSNENDNTTLTWERVSSEWISAKNLEMKSRDDMVVIPRKLSFNSQRDPECWQWCTFQSSPVQGELEIALLNGVRDLSVIGVFDTKYLVGCTHKVALLVRLFNSSSGWESPTKFTLLLPNGSSQQRKANFNEMPRNEYIKVYVGEFMMTPLLVGKMKFVMENDDSNLKSGLEIYMAFIEQHL